MAPHHYSKLVRDRIPTIFEQNGVRLQYHRAGSDEEYYLKLKLKLQESLDQFGKMESVQNFADILEVIDAIGTFKNFDRAELQATRENRALEFGTFQNRVIVELSDLELGLDQDQLI